MRSLFLLLLMLVVSAPGLRDCWAVEQTGQTGAVLSTYLHRRRLPLVQARIIPGPGGVRFLLLYGFVATESGKLAAQSKALHFLSDPTVETDNLIKVRPGLRSLKSSKDGTWLVRSDAAAADQWVIEKPIAELPAFGADNTPDLSDAITDQEATQPLDSFDNDE